jgi:flagellar protein FlaG
MPGWGLSVKDIKMIIQNTSPISQAVQPDMRAIASAPVPAVASAPAQSATPQPSIDELNNAVAAINKVIQQSDKNLEFQVDTSSHAVIVRMMDTSTGTLIRQFPSEATLAISRDIEQFQQGLLFTHKA